MEQMPAIALDKFNALPSQVQGVVLEGLKLKEMDENTLSAITLKNLRGLAEQVRKGDVRFAGHEREVEELLQTLTEHRQLKELEKMPLLI